jgi:hypothetical protein
MSILDFFKNKGNINQSLGQSESDNANRPIYTPEHIDSLLPNEVFVFGSNLAGHHGGGAARTALKRFGAIYGQGVGLQGQSYAIPTMQGGVETIQPYVDDFIKFAETNQDLFFYVTRIGCGIAGFRDEEIAPLFANALSITNVCLPISFVDYLGKLKVPNSYKNQEYGQVRTLADIVKVLNDKNHYTNLTALMTDFENVLEKYIERGTIKADTYEMFVGVLRNDKYVNKGKRIDINSYLTELLSNRNNFEDRLEDIYYQRSISKLIRIIEFFNTRRHYQSSEEIIADISILMNKPYQILNDSYHYPLYFFKRGLENLWKEITIDGVLDNNLLDKIMFEQHEERVNQLGINKVIKMDYQDDGPCHPEVYFPNKLGTAPVYVLYNRCGQSTYVKSCGEGKGPNNDPYFYERRLLEIVEGKSSRC